MAMDCCFWEPIHQFSGLFIQSSLLCSGSSVFGLAVYVDTADVAYSNTVLIQTFSMRTCSPKRPTSLNSSI